LNIGGPFRLITALRQIEPGDTAPIKLTFTPNATMEVSLFDKKEDFMF
jgi:hypothetical protein